MPLTFWSRLVAGLAAGLLLAACASPTPAVVVPQEATVDSAAVAATDAAHAAATEAAQSALRAEQTQAAADQAATEAALPSDTPPPTATTVPSSTPRPTNTPRPTATDAPPTATTPPTAAPTEKPAATQPPAATNPPVATNPPATVAPTEPAAGESIYSWANSGPAGYSTDIYCFRGNVECTPVMTPGDINFTLYLGSDSAAPWGLFDPYGLAVERDGVNVADMFMFVDAGWLEPGRWVQFGASRNFTQPGRYVIRSSGCYTDGSVPCGWANFSGWIVTFDIRP